MRRLVKEFAGICSDSLPVSEPIFEFGSYQVSTQEELANLRPLFQGMKYVGSDMRAGPGVDVILNLHDLELDSETVGTALALDTLEHVEYPRKAISEIHRVLKQGGILIISSVMKFPIHNYPFDYWRYTPEGLKSLLEIFTVYLVESAGEVDFPHTVVGVGIKGDLAEDSRIAFLERVSEWQEKWSEPTGRRSRQLIKSFIPPVLLSLYRKFR